MDEIFCREIPLPHSIRGFVLTDDNNDYNIYININLCDEIKQRTYRHELMHIKNGHLYGALSAAACEQEIKEILRSK